MTGLTDFQYRRYWPSDADLERRRLRQERYNLKYYLEELARPYCEAMPLEDFRNIMMEVTDNLYEQYKPDGLLARYAFGGEKNRFTKDPITGDPFKTDARS